MAYLNTRQRTDLERIVLKARGIAEKGAVNAIKAYAVHEHEPYGHMTSEQRKFRKTLRHKGRLLGDELLENGKQTINKLAYELAYDYWHKMLFAAFLEANHLLLHTSGVAVSFEEVEELAPEEGFPDKWTAAAHYASAMLPAIFRVNDPLMRVDFALNDRIALEEVLDTIEPAIFTADDALGWVYQYWQSEAKEAINKSGDKIDGEKLPAVTQLFTEPYMVHFLIDNTIGAWWVSRNRDKTPPVPFEYLRRLDNGKPAAGAFEGWPATVKELSCMDPCMGSGHFVTSLFQVLAPLRMLEEGLSREEAAARVIQDNLHGLELDARCTQIAAFNLALTAWKFCGRHIELPEMNLACCGIAPKGKVQDWLALLENVPRDDRARMENGMRALYRLFQKAPELGSLIDPSGIDMEAEAGFSLIARIDELLPVLLKALEQEKDTEVSERGVVAAGIAKAGQLLAKKYTLQITNLPYLGKGKFDKTLSDYVLLRYHNAKGELATVFFERLFKTATSAGTVATVIPQNWLFLTSYKKYRKHLLIKVTWNFVARLGPGAFRQISGEVVKPILISITNLKPNKDTIVIGLDVSKNKDVTSKDNELKATSLKHVSQKEQLGNPDSVVAFEKIMHKRLLNDYAYSHHGLTSGDLPRMRIFIWEIDRIQTLWIPFQTTTKETQHYGGLEALLRWDDGQRAINELLGARKDGIAAWGKKGVVISQMGDMPASFYIGSSFDNNTAVITPNDSNNLPALWAFCSSPKYNDAVRKVDQSLAVTSGTMAKVPFDLEYWQKVAKEKYPNGLPKPYSDDATQWLFHGHPLKADQPLQTAIARFLGYRWPAESDEEMELASEARQLIAEVQAFNALSDEDGIVCIPSVATNPPAASRLLDYLRSLWGESWHSGTLRELLAKEGANATKLEKYLRDEFFKQHCKVFGNRPFIWQIWDGRKDGFSALVNYHKLTKANLQKLIYTYLADWLRQCEYRVKSGEGGAEGQLAAAQALKDKLLLILEGEPPYDIFVRWKPLEKQPIGWEPDLNDGVRLNVYPFVQAGVLRQKFNVKWGKDRGKNPEGAVWGPDRYNRYEDLAAKYKLRDPCDPKKTLPHLTNEIKREARRKNRSAE